jgi:agmatine deiminase
VIGHADGVVRFIAEDRVLINDYTAIDPGYGERLHSLLERKGLQVETLPRFGEGDAGADGIASAVGIYINYLRVGDVVVVPGYDTPEDEVALEMARQAMPDARVFQLPCWDLAEEGGVLNCVSWTIKRKGGVPICH